MVHKTLLFRVSVLTLGLAFTACSKNDRANTANNADVKDTIRRDLDAANLNGVKVAFDKDKGLVTLTGDTNTEDDKRQAAAIAQKDAGAMAIANEIGVRPPGVESDAKKIDSSIDTAIEKDYKAVLIANKLSHSGIDYKAKNGTLELSGKVDNANIRSSAERLAKSVPHVAEVVNEIQVKNRG